VTMEDEEVVAVEEEKEEEEEEGGIMIKHRLRSSRLRCGGEEEACSKKMWP
jgi:hypothetical protein